MKVDITYCVMWDYKPVATRVAAEIKKRLNVQTTLIKGEKGIFDVKKDGALVFSKHNIGRFPENGEVTKLLK